MKSKTISAILLSLFCFLAGQSVVHATLSVRLSSDNGTNWVVVDDNGPLDSNPTDGSIVYFGPVSGWALSITGGQGWPFTGNPDVPNMDLLAIDTSGAAASLIAQLSADNLTTFSNQTYIDNTSINTDGTIVNNSYYDSSNVLFGSTQTYSGGSSGSSPSATAVQMLSTGTVSGATTVSNGVVVSATGSASHSVTLEIIINHSGAQSTSVDAHLFARPQPSCNFSSTPLTNQLVNAGAAVVFSTTASGSGPFAYSWFNGTNALNNETNSSLTLTNVSSGDSGTYSVIVTNDCASVTNSAVLQVNQAPVVNAGLDQVVSLSAGAAVHGSVSDDGIPSGAPVTLEWVKVSGPGVVHFGDIDAADSTNTFSEPGIYTLALFASDTMASSSDAVTITVTPPGANQAPTVFAGANQTVGGTNLATLAGVVSDDNFFGTNFLYSWWSLASGPGTVTFANSNAPATAAVFSTNGTYVLTLSAMDSRYTNSSQVTIAIYSDNLPPIVYPGTNQSIITSSTILAGQIQDDGLPSGSALTAHWIQVSGPGTAFFALATSAATTVAFDQPGTYVLQLTGSDSQFSVSSNVSITAEFNQGPAVNAGADQEIVNTNLATLLGQASDDGLPTGSTLSTTWSLVNGPSTATFADIHATNTTVTFGDQGVYQIRLSATDGLLTSSDDVIVIVTSSNAIPYQATNVLYRFSQTPSTNFFLTNLDESTYTNGKGSFGNISFCSLNNSNFIHTIWPGQNGGATYLLTRKHFFLPPGTTNLDMGFTMDNNALIYINGVLITPTNVHQVIINNGANSHFNSFTLYWNHDNCPGYDDLVLSGISTNVWHPGNNLLTVQVFDDGGESFFDARISPNAPTSVLANQPPIPQVNTNQSVFFPSIATLSASIQDDGLPLNTNKTATWSVISGPGTVSFSKPTNSFAFSNDVSTLAAFGAEGSYVLSLTATDSEFTNNVIIHVTVSSISNQPPVVSAGSGQTIALGNSAALNGVATDDGLPFGSLTTFWQALSGPGDVWFYTVNGATYAYFDTVGSYVLQFNASDGALSASNSVTITVTDDIPAPNVAIFTPHDATLVTTPTNIIGTASSSILASYQVRYRLAPPTDGSTGIPTDDDGWIILTNGGTSVVSNTLALFDPTMLLNGIYQVQLVATDLLGRSSFSEVTTLIVDRNLKIGNFTLSFRDLTVPVAGVPIEIVRTYDSRDQRTNDFGVGWSIDVRNVRLQKNRSLGPAWFEDSTGGLFPSYFIDPVNTRDLSVTLANGRQFKFIATFTPESQFGIPIESGTVTYQPTSDTYATLESVRGDDVFVSGSIPGEVDLYDVLTGGFFNPTLFKLTTEEGEVYVIDENEGLKSFNDRNGNTLLISTNGVVWTNVVTGGASVGVTFERDPEGRISQIIDPQGNALTYTYGTNGSLASFTDRETNTTTFAYTNLAFPHYLTGITDPRGVQAIRTEYDSNGRIIRQMDGAGNVINFTNDLSNNREIIRDRLGNVTIHEYDDDGNVTRTTDPLGNVTTSKYDANDNLLEQVDALGNTNSYTYDVKGNKLTETDPLGFTTHYIYGSLRTLTSITNPRGFVTTNNYDADTGELLQEADALGNVTSYSYDGNGNLLIRIDALGNVISNRYDGLGHMTNTTIIDATHGVLNSTSFTYDTNGNQLSKSVTRTTISGPQVLTTSYVYDKENRLLKTTHPDGSTNVTIYAVGLDKPAVEIDPLGRQTLHYYDERGNLTNSIYSDSTSESWHYDAESRQIQASDRAGHVTSFTNDALGRLVITVSPDNTGETNYYDGVGRVIAKSDARGNTSFYGFDAAGRNVAVTNALAQVTRYEYDQSGNRVAMIDALGRTNHTVYDPSDRPVQTVFPDGSMQTTSFDTLGRRTSQQDQSGNITAFTYDGMGRLLAVTNALGYVTTYTYDELGQQLSQTDANSHTTTFEYDSMGRRVKRTLPGSQVETYAYDIEGLLTNRTDFNGFTTTYQYDIVNQLIAKIPDSRRGEPSITFQYNALGLRTNMTDASGSTAYAYDNRNRVVQKTKSWTGQSISVSLDYAYDRAGNLTNIVSSETNGVNVAFAYDELNRLAAVGDAALGVTAYTYDDVGNLQGCTYPNYVHTEYQYNSLNRLTNLASDRLGTAIANYAYKVAASGNRTNAVEQLFTSALNASAKTINRVYTYDSIYHLTGESIGGTLGSGSVSYSYDPVGNRLSRGITSLPLPSQSFIFDSNDHLSTDTYDANGNTLLGSGFGQSANDEYDFENRLITRYTSSCTVTIAYDGDGNRVSKTLTTSSNSVTTYYVVDEVNPSGYAQVLEESVAINSQPFVIDCAYIYGHTLISQDRFNGSQWLPSFYGYDGHNNVRYLTDASANVADTYDYDAFGNLSAQTGNTVNHHLFTGEEYDADLGLYYLRTRYQNPNTGRFWTMDSYEGDTSDPLTLHKYLYTGSDPVGYLDPSGRWAISAAAEALESQMLYSVYRLAPSFYGVAHVVAPVVAQTIVYGLLAAGAISFLEDPQEFVANAVAVPGGLEAMIEEYSSVALRSARAFKASNGFLRMYRAITGKPVTLTAQVSGYIPVGPGYPLGRAPEAAHTANIQYIDNDGLVLAEWTEVSGEQTPTQLAIGFPIGPNSSHTEAKAVTRVFGGDGYELRINGVRPACNSCKGVMRKTSSNGATISYSGDSDELLIYEGGERQ